MLNSNKGKIRVVFDCSSQYKGNSINQNLLTGSQTALHRFKLGPVTFMADIQAMFYHVKVP